MGLAQQWAKVRMQEPSILKSLDSLHLQRKQPTYMILRRDVERLVRSRKGPGSSFLTRRQWAGGVGCTVMKPTDQKMKPKKESIAFNALTEPLTMPGGWMCLFVHYRGFDYPYTHDRASPSLL